MKRIPMSGEPLNGKSMEAQWRIASDLTWRDVNGELVAVNVDSGDFHIFNETAGLIWDAIIAGRGESEIVNEILRQYDAKPEVVVADVTDFLDSLCSLGLVDPDE